jgi:hypothetical protein
MNGGDGCVNDKAVSHLERDHKFTNVITTTVMRSTLTPRKA